MQEIVIRFVYALPIFLSFDALICQFGFSVSALRFLYREIVDFCVSVTKYFLISANSEEEDHSKNSGRIP